MKETQRDQTRLERNDSLILDRLILDSPRAQELTELLWRSFDSMKEISEAVGLKKAQIHRILTGKSSLRAKTARRFARAVGRPPEKLFPELFKIDTSDLGADTTKSANLIQGARLLGISRIKPDDYVSLDEHFAAAKKIRLLRFYGFSLLSPNEDAFVTAFLRGTSFLILLADPASPAVHDLLSMRGETFDARQLAAMLEQTKTKLRDFYRKAEEKVKKLKKNNRTDKFELGHYEIRHFSSEFYCRLILCDENWGWLTLNLPPKTIQRTASFELFGGRDSLLEDSIRYFDAVWDRHAPVKGSPGKRFLKRGA